MPRLDEVFPAILLVLVVLMMGMAGSMLVMPSFDVYRALGL
jgi:hypothetical protein